MQVHKIVVDTVFHADRHKALDLARTTRNSPRNSWYVREILTSEEPLTGPSTGQEGRPAPRTRRRVLPLATSDCWRTSTLRLRVRVDCRTVQLPYIQGNVCSWHFRSSQSKLRYASIIYTFNYSEEVRITPLTFKNLEVKLKKADEKCNFFLVCFCSHFPTKYIIPLIPLMSCFKVIRALVMMALAVLVTTVTARPDSAGIVEMVNGLAYGK